MSASPGLLMPAAADPPLVSNRQRRLDYLPALAIPATPGQFVPSLNGLRAVSIMLVLCSHFISATLFPGGFGVTVFFAISGFLITRLLLAEGKQYGRISLRNFYLRRLARIQPVVLAYTVAVLCLYLAVHQPIHWIEPFGVVLNFANYLYAPIGAAVGVNNVYMPFVHLWSLSVEEHFYLILPATLLFLHRRPAQIVWLMAAVCAACLAWRIAAASAAPHLLQTRFFFYRTDCRLDALAYGTALAALCELSWGAKLLQTIAHPVTIALSLLTIMISLVIRDEFFRQTFRYSLQSCAIAALMCAILFRPGLLPRLLNLGLVNWVGVVSYSLYVCATMAEILVHGLHLSRRLDIPLCFASAFALAFVSYHALERPLAKLRHSLSQTR